MVIQQLSISKYAEVLDLWKVLGLEPRVDGRDHPDHMDDQLQSGNVVLLGKIIADQLVGVVLVTHDNRKGWINRLTVHPDHQNQGIGKELLIAAEAYLLSRKGIEVYSALIFNDNSASKRCFQNAGYIHWEEVGYYSKRVSPES